MSEKKYTILISCIACLLAVLLVLFVRVSTAYAAESEDDTSEPLVWMFWNIYDDDNDASTPNVSKEIDFPKKDVFGSREHLDSLSFPAVAKEGCAYNYHVRRMYTNSYHLDNYTWSSESEIIGFLWANKNRNIALASFGVRSEESYTPLDIVFVSMSDIYSNLTRTDSYNANTNEWSRNMQGPYNESNAIDKKGTDASGNEFWTIENYFTGTACKTGFGVPQNMKIFKDPASAYSYLTTGSLDGLVSGGSSTEDKITSYDKNIHFDSFNMDVHASNSLDNYYIDFRYSLPNNLVGTGYSLRIDSTYRREVTNSITGESLFSKDYTDYQYVTLSDNPFSCRIYLKNFNSIKSSFKDKYSDPFSKYMDVTSNNYDSVYLGITSHIDQIGYDVTLSLLSLSCKLEKSGSRGYVYDGSLNLLTGANDIGSYTPDSSGNYKPNNDYRQNGYYYTDVTTDAAENTTYNYYYITNDNSRTEISKDDNDNNTKSGEGIGGNSTSSASTSGNITNNNNNSPTFNNNNNITIEGDSINNEVNNIVDSSSSAEDNKNFIEKFLGFFQLLENNSFLGVWGKVFGWLPSGISSVITTALGISAGIGIFRFFRR